ncbi:c-type cytochrome biogenesis protein CcsB [Sporosarcina sp. Te-1]|uniref:c-type cytochrome biogenesis protein CcsB n=1 Tax=Sporosarcina sp. Te-1 TaxID=2818390 RepID=UPI001A9E6B97|nr:c-type cytochrome biogenesis protein CcsB [Sporosarcina sp. Te-1]QTD42962.1 c-type cytochrome biogenesis protein CcsB [Sporosarcina sp. Te-1]
MTSISLIELSSQSLFLSFLLLLVAIVPIGAAIRSKRKWLGRIGLALTYVAFSLQLIYFTCRWAAIGHAPVSNMYEFMTFFGIMLVGSTLLIHYLYKQLVVPLFSIPITLIIIGYGAVFTREASPLVPALQSHWLAIHVITVALSSAVLSVAFATGLIYLLRITDVDRKTSQTRGLEFVMYCLIVVIGFIISSLTFSMTTEERVVRFENGSGIEEKAVYHMPVIFITKDAVGSEGDEKIGAIPLPDSIDAKKLNSITWAFLTGTILYILFRILTRRKVIQVVKPLTKKVNLPLMDEISYRAILIGFPLFSLGGLLFAMIWAHFAWGRFWGWDPKEVWALITWLFYAGFLHLRTSREWQGKRTAWMAIIGFGLIVFNQVFVNLVISGLHSYT